MSGANAKAKGHRKWILLAEDDDDLRMVIKENIEAHYNNTVKVVEARDGVEASSKLKGQAFDCIITDLNMPNRDGRSFIEWIKRSAMNNSTPIIVATGFLDEDLGKEHREIVMIEKPYSVDLLAEKVEQQFKLGRLDQRVGAEVLNTLVMVCNEFIKQVVFDSPGEIKPELKRNGQDLMGDVVSCMKIKTVSGTCRLGLGFSGELVENMYHSVGLGKDISQEKLVDVALKVIFKITGKLFNQITGEFPTLDERVVFTDKDNDDVYNWIKSAKGIIIPIESEKGCLYAHALYVNDNSTVTKKAG